MANITAQVSLALYTEATKGSALHTYTPTKQNSRYIHIRFQVPN